jgi:hypothetical protein
MRTSHDQDNFHSKQRLRLQISNQTIEFLSSGGRIEVVTDRLQQDQHVRAGYKAAAIFSVAPGQPVD